MNPLLLLPVLELGKSLLEKMFPDAGERARAEFELLKMTQQGDLDVIIKQLEVNAKEAEHHSIFVAGWRPFVGWTCGVGLAWAAIGQNLAAWISEMYSFAPPPAVDVDLLIYVLGGMLGIASLRTYEKKSGVTK